MSGTNSPRYRIPRDPRLPRPVPVVPDERYRTLVDTVRDYGIFLLDANGFVLTWNAGAARIKGYQASEIIGQHFSRFYPPEVAASGWPEHELEAARQVGRFEDEGWRVRKDGTRFWASVVITALFDKQGNLEGYSKVTRDLSERRRQEESLRQSEERFRLMIETVEEYAIFMLDPQGLVATWNAGARRLHGFRSDEVLGRNLSIFHTPEDIARKKPERELQWARDRGRIEGEGWRVRKDQSQFWANIVVTALHDRDGTLVGFVVVTRDMTERRRVEMLEESGRQMQEFLAMLAHELRNPLAPIRNATDVMSVKPLEDPSLEWSREVIVRQVGHLSRLVDDLLDVSRITSGRIVLQRSSIDIGAVIERAVEASRPWIEARRQRLEVLIPEHPMCVDGDLVRLSQALINLLNNAAKFTAPEGLITLRLTREQNTAVITVTDTGIGMSAELLPHVFDLFRQGSRGEDRSEGGLGVGLTLVRRLIEMHGGQVSASSAGPGLGSEFVMRLPLHEGAVPPAEPGRPRVASHGASRRVLVVDDNHDSADSMSLLLRLKGHDVRTAHDGPDALRIAAEYHPEIVLLDIGLPGMSGYQVAQLLRDLPGLRDVTLVAVTGYGQDEDRRRALEAGLDRHLTKPVEPSAIEEVLSTPSPTP
jgi:PAS domain S-box-containing protein